MKHLGSLVVCLQFLVYFHIWLSLNNLSTLDDWIKGWYDKKRLFSIHIPYIHQPYELENSLIFLWPVKQRIHHPGKPIKDFHWCDFDILLYGPLDFGAISVATWPMTCLWVGWYLVLIKYFIVLLYKPILNNVNKDNNDNNFQLFDFLL